MIEIVKGYVVNYDKNYAKNGRIVVAIPMLDGTVDLTHNLLYRTAEPFQLNPRDWLRPYPAIEVHLLRVVDTTTQAERLFWLATDMVSTWDDLKYEEITRVICDGLGSRIIFHKDGMTIDQVGVDFSGDKRTDGKESEETKLKNPQINRMVWKAGKITLSQFKKGAESTPTNTVDISVGTSAENDSAVAEIKLGQDNDSSIVMHREKDKSNITVSTKSGAKVLLDDTKDKETVSITDGKNKNSITMDKDGMVILAAKTTITIDKDGNLKIESSGDVKIKAKKFSVNDTSLTVE